MLYTRMTSSDVSGKKRSSWLRNQHRLNEPEIFRPTGPTRISEASWDALVQSLRESTWIIFNPARKKNTHKAQTAWQLLHDSSDSMAADDYKIYLGTASRKSKAQNQWKHEELWRGVLINNKAFYNQRHWPFVVKGACQEEKSRNIAAAHSGSFLPEQQVLRPLSLLGRGFSCCICGLCISFKLSQTVTQAL